MISQEMVITRSAVNFAARFGFIHQELFFEYFCNRKKSQSYNYWGKLLTNGSFIGSSSDKHIFYLSAKGRRGAEFEPVPTRNIYLVPHDLLVAKIILELELSGLVVESWTEAELLGSASTTYQVLGVNRIDKLPDLVVDLKGKDKVLRLAFEIEHSRKTKERYDRMAVNYLSMKNINLVIFGASHLMIAQSIKRSFSGDLFLKSQKSPIIFANDAFKHLGFDVEAELLNTKTSLKRMILAALEHPDSEWRNSPEKCQNLLTKIPNKSKREKEENA